jgi:hypothetical protein
MTRSRSLLLVFFLFILTFGAIGQETENTLNKDEMEKDLSFMVDYVLKLHPTIGVNIKQETYEEWVKQIQQQLPQKADKVQFLSIIEPLIDSLKCGHTTFLLDEFGFTESVSGDVPGFLPLRVTEIEHKIIISQNLSEDSLHIQEGFELLKINGTEIGEVLDQIGRLHIGSDGNNKTGEAYYSAFLLPFGYKMFFGEPDTFSLELRDLQADSLSYAAFPAPSLGSIRTHYQTRYKDATPKETVELEILKEDRLAVLSVHAFSGYDPFQILFKARLKEIFVQLSNEKIDKLIIDVRGNRGGSIRNCQKLLGYLLLEKRSFFKEASLNPSYHLTDIEPAFKLKFSLNGIRTHSDRLELKSWGKKSIKPHRKYNFDGKMILVTDAGSFSAAAIFSSIIKSTQRAQLIGSESGGSYFQTFAGFTKKITLPNSQLKLNIPMVRFVHSVDENLQPLDKGVMPDVEILTTIKDYFNKIDPQMDYAKGLLKGNK